MRRLFRSSRLLWAVLVLFGLTFGWTLDSNVAGELVWSRIDAAARNDTTRRWEEFQKAVPHFDLEQALFAYQHYRRDPDRYRLALKLYVIRHPEARVKANREYVEWQDWPKFFRDDFDKEINWLKRVSAMPPDDIFELSRRLKGRVADDASDEVRSLNGSISHALAIYAENAGSGAAMYFHAKANLVSAVESARIFGCNPGAPELVMWKAADLEYGPAIIDLISMYLIGRCVAEDFTRAYYWVLRGRRAGIDVSGPAARVEAGVSPGQRSLAENWLARAEVPSVHDYKNLNRTTR
ncbi:MAG: hypothetical protein OXH94_04455 [Rhodospirillales bacterium]|nr:hypothetical protein [Rhodospirillales bacterium]